VQALLTKALEELSDEMTIEGLCALPEETAIESVEKQRCWRVLQEMVSGEKDEMCRS